MSTYPRLLINITSIRDNTEFVVRTCGQNNIKITGVTKSFCGQPPLAATMLQGGVEVLADSRMDNLRLLRKSFPEAKLMLLRITMPGEAKDTVAICDRSVNSELATIEQLNTLAGQAGKKHGIILMVDMGDLREGLWPDDVLAAALSVEGLPHVELIGLATNFGCFGGVLPDEVNTSDFARLALEVEAAIARPLEVVSIGGSTCLELAQSGQLHPKINDLRIGEAISVGTNASQHGAPIPGMRQDGFRLLAELAEIQDKPSVPIGQIGPDAFGHVPHFTDKGIMRRGVLAIGKQDTSFDLLRPVDTAIEILGGSSDHMICDLTSCREYRVGDVVEFEVGWSAMLHLMTSPYVEKEYLK